MGNKVTGEVTFTALGSEWTLKAGNAALCDIENVFDMSIQDVVERRLNAKRPRLVDVTRVFYCLLKGGHVAVAFETAHRIIDEIGYERVGDLVRDAFERSLPPSEAGDGSHPRKAAAA